MAALSIIKNTIRIRITLHGLISVSLKMHAANNKGIRILGAAILRFNGEDKNNTTVETHQITYITDSSDKIVLSWKFKDDNY